MATQRFTSREGILEALGSSVNAFENNILAMYNSRIRGIIHDPVLMSIAVDDHMVHRGHAVFDTCSVHDGKAYNLPRHLRRLANSAEKAKISLSCSIADLEKIILDLAASTKEKNLFIRYWASAGPGNFAILPSEGSSSFYAVAYKFFTTENFESRNEHFVEVPTKPKLLANMKSNNYMLNALCAMESYQKGGKNGIQVNPDGSIAEGSINNVAFLLKCGTFVTPPFDLILNGTTVERVIEFAKVLASQGIISDVQQRNLGVEDALSSLEALAIGGDSISAILSLDGIVIGDGKVGNVTKRLQEMLIEDFANPELTQEINYATYE